MMNSVEIFHRKKWFGKGKWVAQWHNGDRTFIHGHHLYSSKEFDSLKDLMDWAESQYSFLDAFTGGGYGVGVTLYLDGMVIAEFWRGRGSGSNESKVRYVHRRYIKTADEALSNTGNIEDYAVVSKEKAENIDTALRCMQQIIKANGSMTYKEFLTNLEGCGMKEEDIGGYLP